MSADNYPENLLKRHLDALSLLEPIYIRDENDLLSQNIQDAESTVVFLPKSKDLIDMTLALVSSKVKSDSKVILVGEKSAGIESAKKIYERNIGPVEQKLVGNHSALYVGKNQRLSAVRKIEDFISFSPISYKNVSIDAANLPGVFSAGELDEGTKLLLDNIPYDKKKVLDMACGSGVIGAIYKKINPNAEVTLSDLNKLAVIASQKTFEKNDIVGNILESDVFDKIEGKFDLILVNPPFHKGIDTDYSFIERFAKGAKEHLNSGGNIYVVANSFLPYGDILNKHIGKTDIITDTKKFRIFKSGL